MTSFLSSRTASKAEPVQRARAARRLFMTVLMLPLIALAAIVTAAQVADAIRSSPTANAFMKANADQIGALAVKVESGGNTQAYNGSCCYGILQLNTANIRVAGYNTPQDYLQATLQQQIDGWTKVQALAMNDPVVAKLASMTTFDGHAVDASLLIACVQLGQGNCAKMINSGKCSGFADRNGTTICSMADQMNAAIGNTRGGGVGGGGSGGGGGGGGGTNGGWTPPTGGESPNEAFQRATGGISTDNSANAFKTAVAAVIFIWAAWSAVGSWTQFQKGQLLMFDLGKTLARSALITMLVIMLLN